MWGLGPPVLYVHHLRLPPTLPLHRQRVRLLLLGEGCHHHRVLEQGEGIVLCQDCRRGENERGMVSGMREMTTVFGQDSGRRSRRDELPQVSRANSRGSSSLATVGSVCSSCALPLRFVTSLAGHCVPSSHRLRTVMPSHHQRYLYHTVGRVSTGAPRCDRIIQSFRLN